jgi:hypothetical protein
MKISRSPGLALLLLAAACANQAPPPPPAPPMTVGFAAGLTDVLQVSIIDRQPMEQATLIGPDGKGVAAYQISRDRIAGPQDPGIAAGLGFGAYGGSSNGVSSGFGLGFPLFGSPPPPAVPVVQSQALIRVGDMTAYRAGWQQWKLRLRMGSPETTEHDVEFPAPRPPDS